MSALREARSREIARSLEQAPDAADVASANPWAPQAVRAIEEGDGAERIVVPGWCVWATPRWKLQYSLELARRHGWSKE